MKPYLNDGLSRHESLIDGGIMKLMRVIATSSVAAIALCREKLVRGYPMKASFGLAAVCATLVATPAYAAVDFSLFFEPVEYSGSNSDTILFDATVTNTGTENLLYSNGSSFSLNDLAPYFVTGGFGPTSVFSDYTDQFIGFNLAPSSTFTFTFANITYAGAPDGSYNVGSNSTFTLVGADTGSELRQTIDGPALLSIGSAVPEPSTWAMLLLGFLGVGIALRRRRINQNFSVSNA